MITYVEYLNVPAKVAIAIISLFLLMQLVGEILEFKGKVVPEFVKIRKYFTRKKKERESREEANRTLEDVKNTLAEVKVSMDTMNAHYNLDNIKMRDAWIRKVNDSLNKYDSRLDELSEKLDKNNQDTLELLIENMRSTIIGFATTVADPGSLATREQFNRVFKIYHRYESIITEHKMTNGEVDIAYRIIKESYETHLRNHSFIEDVRGYTDHN